MGASYKLSSQLISCTQFVFSQVGVLLKALNINVALYTNCNCRYKYLNCDKNMFICFEHSSICIGYIFLPHPIMCAIMK